jgi:hypothetical protein
MSRDEILSKLLSFGAMSLVLTIQDVEAGRVRRVSIPTIPGDAVFSREVLGLLRSLGAEVDFAARGGGSYRLRSLSRG